MPDPPATSQRGPRLISYRLSLVLVTSLLVAASGGLIILNAWLTTRRTVAALTERLFAEATHRAVVHTRDRVRLAVPAIDLLDRRLTDTPALLADRDALASELLDVLRANPEFAWVSYSDAAGAFTGAYRAPDGTLKLNESTLHEDGRTELFEWTLDAHDQRALARHEADTHYDPRARPFYRDAVARHGRTWTAPYVFFGQNVPGITCADPVYAPDGASLRGVLTVDFDLDELSAYLAQRHFSTNRRLVIFTADGTLVAGAQTPVVRRGAGGAYELASMHTVDDPLIRTFYAEAVRHGADARDANHAEQFAFAHDGRAWFGGVDAFELDGGMRWVVGATAPESDFMGDVARSNLVSLLISAIALATTLLLVAFFATRMSARLTLLAREMERVGQFRLDDDGRRHPPTLLREIAQMDRALGAMKQGLRSFASYVPRDLVRAVLASGQEATLGGRVRPLTVFFSDIAGFTSVAEEMAPDALVALLGGYLDGMTRVIAAEKGTVDKFIGDGIMAFWGAPEELEDHAARACEAALRCQAKLAQMQRDGSAEMQRLATRIGLATGEVLVGNIGTPERMNYTVMGDVANLASRLEGLNKQYGTRVMASEATVRAAGGRVVARAIDVVAVKGKARGVRVYELLALASDGDARAVQVAALSGEALDAYLARDFAGAEARWSAVLELWPGDSAATLMRDRARAYAANAPPDAWHGVSVAHEK